MSAQVNRSLTTIKTELEFLLSSNVITKALFENIVSSLPDNYTDGSPAKDLNMSNPSQAAPPSYSNNAEEYAEAIYAYQPQQADDLELRQGDKVLVLEKTSENWWKGKVGSSVGMFPSNYVRLVGAHQSPADRPAAPIVGQQQYYQQQPLQPIYAQPIQQQQSSSMPFPPAEFQQQPQQQQPQQQQQQQHHHGSEGLKKFGKKLGNAAIFGAGATIGSDLINSIF